MDPAALLVTINDEWITISDGRRVSIFNTDSATDIGLHVIAELRQQRRQNQAAQNS